MAMNIILTMCANKTRTDYPKKVVPSPSLFVFKTGTRMFKAMAEVSKKTFRL